MTSIVGVLCADGVVVGADSSATFGSGTLRTIEQPSEKIDVVAHRVIVAGTGQFGMGQRFVDQVTTAHGNNLFGRAPIDVGRELAAAGIRDFTATAAPKASYGALVAFPCRGGFHLCEFAVADFQPELKIPPNAWYASMGSAQPITDPFLGFIREVFWRGGLPNLNAGIFATVWTLQQAIDLNTGGVKAPIRVAVLERTGGEFVARKLTDGEIGEHLGSVAAAKEHLSGFALEVQRPGAPDPPPRPQAAG